MTGQHRHQPQNQANAHIAEGSQPLPLFGNDFAITLGLVYAWFPDMVLPCYAAIERLSRDMGYEGVLSPDDKMAIFGRMLARQGQTVFPIVTPYGSMQGSREQFRYGQEPTGEQQMLAQGAVRERDKAEEMAQAQTQAEQEAVVSKQVQEFSENVKAERESALKTLQTQREILSSQIEQRDEQISTQERRVTVARGKAKEDEQKKLDKLITDRQALQNGLDKILQALMSMGSTAMPAEEIESIRKRFIEEMRAGQ